jgi:hypothetical protein
MKRCNSCGIEKEEKEFNYRYKTLGIRHPTCKECQKGFRKNWYEGSAKEKHLENVKARKLRVRDEAREYVYQYLSSHPCEQCGESDPMVLEFHHLEGKDKAVSEIVAAGYPIHKIQAEINKSIVLCANCHRRLTMKERGWFRGRK